MEYTMNNFTELNAAEMNETDGGIVITTTTLLICAGASLVLGCATGAGIYVGYKEAGK